MSDQLRALVFDLDGTLADTEGFHRRAFNLAFAAERIDWHWDHGLYAQLLDVSGGKERLLHYWARTRGGAAGLHDEGARRLVDRIHRAKSSAYEAMVAAGMVHVRPGVVALMEQARARGLRLAVATTTSPVNVARLLRQAMGPQWHLHVPVVCDASTTLRRKPHPDVYLQVLQQLRLPAGACMAFEDSGNGLRAASAAGMDTVITPTAFSRDHDFDDALRVLPSLSGVSPDDLQRWRVQPLAPVRA